MELYRELITPYTGSSPLAVPTAAPLGKGQLLCLAVPVLEEAGTGFWLDDPLFPLECEVPAGRVRPFRKLLAIFAAEPVVTVERMTEHHLPRSPAALRTLEWMIETGLVLRSLGLPGGIAPEVVPPEAARPLFSFQRLPLDGPDFVVSG